MVAVEFQLLFELGGGVVESHSGTEKFEKSLKVNISRIVVALNEGSAIKTIFFFYSRCYFFKKDVGDLVVIVKYFVVAIDFSTNGVNSVGNTGKVFGKGLEACQDLDSLTVLIVVVAGDVCIDVVVQGFVDGFKFLSIFFWLKR